MEMNNLQSLPFNARLEEYQEQARTLFERVKSRDEAAEWRYKWMHPDFRGKSVADVRAAALQLSDAQAVVARGYGFEKWADLAAFAEAVRHNRPVSQFETAVEAIIAGEAAALLAMLPEHPEVARARSTRKHKGTLL